MSLKKKKTKKRNPKIAQQKFTEWLMSNYLWYGDPYVVWWKERGCKDFTKWAFDRGLEYQKKGEK